jgi:hypothetical protein
MPAVRNGKSQAKDFCDGVRKGRGRRAKRVCSLFVPFAVAFAAAGTYLADTVEDKVGDQFSVANSLPTVNSPERSVSRESEAAAKRMDTAEASMTRCWCRFKRA